MLEFTTDSPFYEYLPVEFRVKFKNTGNIHLAPGGTVFIDGVGKKDIGIIRVNEVNANILPQTERLLTTKWDDAFIVRVPKVENGKAVLDKDGKPVYTTKWNLTKLTEFRIGRYTANLLAVFDNGQRDVPLSATVSFWVIPWKLLAGFGVILLLVLVGLRSTLLSTWKKLRKKHRK